VKETSEGYLETIGASLLRGRTIQSGDVAGAPAVVVINDAAATRYFGSRDPIGGSVTLEGDAPRKIVGVVRAMRLLGPEAALQPEAYVPYAQSTNHSVFGSLVVRTSGNAAAIVPAVKNAVWSVLPDASIPEPETFEQLYAGLIAQRKLNMLLLALFGALALLIASIGIYGVFAYAVEQRAKEIGVRMALGALPGRIAAMVLGRAVGAVAVGLAMGFIAAAWLERGIMTFVYSGRARDPMVYGAAAMLVLAIGCLAAYVPARRASRVDPLVAIRAE
jgi:putative ABC transport system permease protein